MKTGWLLVLSPRCLRAGASVFLLALLCACASGDRGRFAPAMRDSAGVSIVEYPALGDSVPALQFDETPFLELGATGSDTAAEFDPRQPFLSVTTLSDGTLAVTDMQAIKFFDSSGKFIRAVGRRGTGPGEFRQLRGLCLMPGDSLLAIDYSRSGLSVWDGEGKFVRRLATVGSLEWEPCFADGTILAPSPRDTSAGSSAPAPAPAAVPSGFLPYARLRLDGTVVAQLGLFPTSSFDGGFIREVSIVPMGDRLYVGDGKTYQVRVQNLEGKVVRIIRVAEKLVPIDASTSPDFAMEAGSTQPPGVPPLSASHPATLPAYSRVRVDPAHRIWIQGREKRAEWTVFDSTGVLLGRVNLGERVGGEEPVIATLERDHFVVCRWDAQGAARLSFHRLK